MSCKIESSAKYKYCPEDFESVLGLSHDLEEFYQMYEHHKNEKTQHSMFEMERQARELFFTLKHRRIEGAITQTTAKENLEYVEDLLND